MCVFLPMNIKGVYSSILVTFKNRTEKIYDNVQYVFVNGETCAIQQWTKEEQKRIDIDNVDFFSVLN